MSAMETPDALRLADELDEGRNFYAESSLWYDRKLSDAVSDAADELRRLHCVNALLLAAVKRVKETGVFVGAIAHGMMDEAIAAAEGVARAEEGDALS